MECEHKNKQFRCKLFSNQTHHYAYQCLRCGRKVGNWLKREFASTTQETTPEWDEELEDNWYESRRGDSLIKSNSKELSSDTEYQLYLKSPNWHDNRELVLQRDKHWCQGCRRRSAIIVHHLTYAHIYGEFLWELLSVCKDCHDRCHGRGDYAQNT